MSTLGKSRWAEDDAETEASIAQQKLEKEEKKRAKVEKQRKQEQLRVTSIQSQQRVSTNAGIEPPTKRRRLSNELEAPTEIPQPPRASSLLEFPASEWSPCRHVDNYEILNHIEEGSYGSVSRAKNLTTGEIVALKKLKIENTPDGFPVTGLREIQTLQQARHEHIVYLREVVLGNKMDE